MDDEEFLRRAQALAKKRDWSESTASRKIFNGNPRKLARMRNALYGKVARKRRAAAEKCLKDLEAEEGERVTLCR